MKALRYLLLSCLLLVFLFSCDENVVEERLTINSLEHIRNDMLLAHEGNPSGVLPSFDWAEKPRIGYGNTPPEGWNAMLAWGQVYADSEGNPATNTRFQIRNMEAWYLSREDGKWHEWGTTSNINGANYAEDFQNDANISADLRVEEEGVSSTVVPGYNFHFWSDDGRSLIQASDIAGVWVSIESRLIIDDNRLTDDRDQARLLFSAGADYWLDLNAEWDQWTTNGDIGIGRFRYLTKEWQAFNMHTLTEQQLQNNPPPFR